MPASANMSSLISPTPTSTSHSSSCFLYSLNYKQRANNVQAPSVPTFAGASVSLNITTTQKKKFILHASWLTTSQIVTTTSVFTVGTAAVLPFYALMIFAPKTHLTNKITQSSFPYVILGLVYAYLLYLSWTPDSISLMFSGQYLLPELSGITKLFSSEMTLASAWIHFLAVDLFAARQIFHDGLESKVETRHSISLCLFCCPLGIFTHFITKALTCRAAKPPRMH